MPSCCLPLLAHPCPSAPLPSSFTSHTSFQPRDAVASPAHRNPLPPPLPPPPFPAPSKHQTPSLVPPELLQQILLTLRAQYGINPGAEISIEADPGTFDQARLEAYIALGVSRISVGVQSFHQVGVARGGSIDFQYSRHVHSAWSQPNQCRSTVLPTGGCWCVDLF